MSKQQHAFKSVLVFPMLKHTQQLKIGHAKPVESPKQAIPTLLASIATAPCEYYLFIIL